jgi:aspartate/methionine/tyrosine aminotransferase
VIVPTPTFFFDGAIRLTEAVPGLRAVPGGGRVGMGHRPRAEGRRPAHQDDPPRNPNNPTGFLPSRDDLAEIVTLARKRDLVVVSDESFHYATRRTGLRQPRELRRGCRAARHRPQSQQVPRAASWRMGYIHAPAAMLDAFATLVEWECLHCGYVQQRVTHAAITGPQDWLAGINEEYRSIRDRLIAAIGRSEWISAVTPAAGPFLFPDFSKAEAASQTGAFEQLLELGIPTVPGHYFQGPRHVRLPIGADPQTVDRLVERLEHFTPNKGFRRGGN